MDKSTDFTKKIDEEILKDAQQVISQPNLPEEEPDDNKFFFLILGLIIVFGSIIGGIYWYEESRSPVIPESEIITYKGFEFTYYDDLWHFQWQRDNDLYNVHLRFNPEQAQTVSVYEKSPFNNFTTESVYITFDPVGNLSKYTPLAVAELTLSMKKVFGKNPLGACTQNKTEPCSTRPIITCENTNESVVLFEEKPISQVFVDGNCLIIQGKEEELIRSADRVLYEWYGILD